jgi:hypothetical protein
MGARHAHPVCTVAGIDGLLLIGHPIVFDWPPIVFKYQSLSVSISIATAATPPIIVPAMMSSMPCTAVVNPTPAPVCVGIVLVLEIMPVVIIKVLLAQIKVLEIAPVSIVIVPEITPVGIV